MALFNRGQCGRRAGVPVEGVPVERTVLSVRSAGRVEYQAVKVRLRVYGLLSVDAPGGHVAELAADKSPPGEARPSEFTAPRDARDPFQILETDVDSRRAHFVEDQVSPRVAPRG